MSLTDRKVKSAISKEKMYFITDDDGLSLKIDITGHKSWVYRYTNKDTGKRHRIKLGDYPDLNLKQARIARDDYKDSLNITRPDKTILTFGMVANEWLDFKYKNSLGDNPRCGVLSLAKKCLEKDINPNIGRIPFGDIERIDLVNSVRKIESRGVKEPARKACSYLSQIYDYAVGVGYAKYNIAVGLNKILITKKVKMNYPYLKSNELAEFINKLFDYKADPIIKKALWLKLYTGVRGAELIQAKPEHFDLENKIWRIPAVHVKQLRRKALMGFDVPDYLVPLSDQAIEIVKSALEWSHGEKYIFASPRKVGQHIHFNSINTVIRRMGYDKDKLSSHGLRSTMSTILNESGLFKSEWIEAQLSHSDKDQTRGSYNHAEYISQRLDMMQWWGNYLEGNLENNIAE